MSVFGRGFNFECPTCGTRMIITQTDWSNKRNGLQRRRVCPVKTCNVRFTTIETVVLSSTLHPFGRPPK